MLKIETHIAWRYLIAKKRQNAINIISGVSCLAVAVVTAAMICVLSVMNGFGEAVEQMFSQLDAELRITPAEGKTIHLGDERIRALYSLEGIELIAPTIEETAIVEFRGRQVPAMLKGVDTTYQQLTSIDSIIIDGNYAVWDGAFERCVMGVGLEHRGYRRTLHFACTLVRAQARGYNKYATPGRELPHQRDFYSRRFCCQSDQVRRHVHAHLAAAGS